jgi:formate dehydrogenase subunit gamma
MTEHAHTSDRMIQRFGTGRIIEHTLIVFVVIALVMTGLSQKLYSMEIAQWFILKCGGIDQVRVIHRSMGTVLMILTLVHVFVAMFGVAIRRWQPSMMINQNDFTDALHTLRYYVGRERGPARFDRYDFKQKFEYWAILVGIFLMVFSGLILWFPMEVTHFLPGEIVPASKSLHTHEASLLFILISMWHIYNAIFSPEVFPLDTSILTGMISRERMVREHPLELARLEGVPVEELSQRPRKEVSDAAGLHSSV